jgi:hypothetical protein
MAYTPLRLSPVEQMVGRYKKNRRAQLIPNYILVQVSVGSSVWSAGVEPLI